MRIAMVLGLAGLCLLSPPGIASSRAGDATQESDALTETTVTVMSGSPFDGHAVIVRDMAAVLDDSPSLRVVPMIGRGPAQTLKDVLFLDGVDMGITHSTVLNHFAETGELGPIRDRLVYVAKLFNEDLHLLARADNASVQSLSGKTVNVGPAGSGTEIAARIVFEALGLHVEEAHLDTADAIVALKSGEIAATIVIGTTPITGLTRLGPDSGLALLPIPYAKGLEDDTYPSALAHDDYPGLIEHGERIDTVSICTVLVALNDQADAAHQAKIERFVGQFFSTFDALQQQPHHPKWREVNFAATLEDWRRAPQAQAWLDTARSKAVAEAREQASFKAFLTQAGDVVSPDAVSEADQEKLFRAFKAGARPRSN
ncbi:hypothetical protein AUC68_01195 [Methyloceanibacter methanicus]|uniref:SsuA/THI5-like domain-containing protein n=1 Tax=Methyloceanibacter methanicus TaxID=1774968 RepID=A0A1E3W1W9_9HYPH|nr:TAXI family TRAP transporter solute-binding subunit [Methyloceanibacter methanicus]ODR99795.1 hypothetical protein AUC68_01195 [Methyloceanibacter methanicus]